MLVDVLDVVRVVSWRSVRAWGWGLVCPVTRSSVHAAMGAEESKPPPTRSSPPQLRNENQSEAFSCFVTKEPARPSSRARPPPPPTFRCCGGGKSNLSRSEILQTTKEYHNDSATATVSSYQAVIGSILDMTDEAYYRPRTETMCVCKGECSCAFQESRKQFNESKQTVKDYERKYNRKLRASAFE